MTLAFLNIGTQEMILIVIVLLLLFGGKKLPELARGLGKGIREFKDASEGIKREISDQINNFDKDVEEKKIAETPAEPVTQQTETAQTASTASPDQEKKLPQFSAPEGTYQHEPGRQPDYDPNANHYNYGYNDHFASNQQAEVPSEEQAHAAVSPQPSSENKPEQKEA
ncbi:Sec-independent protein translocase subunit TatA/TatB [Sphingobacterium spiritivorum]|uniref:Sec-independent protein translocase subunit TatA/TatB n=1 Tax=Sphingobacterium spiritivorum TaxID=258 RepID=UPI003DA2A6C8